MLASLILANALTLAILLGMIGGAVWMIATMLADMAYDARCNAIRARRAQRRNALWAVAGNYWRMQCDCRAIGAHDARDAALDNYRAAQRAANRFDAQTNRIIKRITGRYPY